MKPSFGSDGLRLFTKSVSEAGSVLTGSDVIEESIVLGSDATEVELVIGSDSTVLFVDSEVALTNPDINDTAIKSIIKMLNLYSCFPTYSLPYFFQFIYH